MKIKNIINILLVSVLTLSIVSCVEEAPEYVPGTPDADNCYSVHFAQEATNIVINPTEAKTTEIVVKRLKTNGAITVPLNVIGATDVISVPSSVDFKDGQGEAVLKVDFSKAGVDKTYEVNIAVSDDPQFSSKYNKVPLSTTVSVLIENFEYIGKVDFLDALIYVIDDNNMQIQKVDLLKKAGENLYRIVDPFQNTEAIKNAWGPNCITPDRSMKWEFTVGADNALEYGEIKTGCLYQDTDPILEVYPALLGQNASKSQYIPQINLYQLEPYGFVPALGGGFGVVNVWVGGDESVSISALLGL